MEKRLFEDLIDSDRVAHRTQQSKTLPVSLALHTIAAALIVIVPLLSADQLPDPASAVKAFFVEPMAAPAPPPPAPPAARPANAPKVIPSRSPKPVRRPVGSRGDHARGEYRHGRRGGGRCRGRRARRRRRRDRGGCRAPPPPVQAVRVGGQIKEPKKIKNVAPAYPDIAKQARVQGVVILECTISPQGKVTDVKVLRGIPLLDSAATDAVKQWVYTPTLLNGVPVPVIMTVTVNFKLS
jgi:protein TonB